MLCSGQGELVKVVHPEGPLLSRKKGFPLMGGCACMHTHTHTRERERGRDRHTDRPRIHGSTKPVLLKWFNNEIIAKFS